MASSSEPGRIQQDSRTARGVARHAPWIIERARQHAGPCWQGSARSERATVLLVELGTGTAVPFPSARRGSLPADRVQRDEHSPTRSFRAGEVQNPAGHRRSSTRRIDCGLPSRGNALRRKFGCVPASSTWTHFACALEDRNKRNLRGAELIAVHLELRPAQQAQVEAVYVSFLADVKAREAAMRRMMVEIRRGD